MLVHGCIYAREIINLLTLSFFSVKTVHINNFFNENSLLFVRFLIQKLECRHDFMKEKV